MTAPDTPAASIPAADVVVHVFGRTDVGRTREHNEDAFLVADLTAGEISLGAEVRTHTPGDRGTLFMVADGLGGAAAGEIASELAVDTVYQDLRARWSAGADTDPDSFAASLRRATEAANARIFGYALEHPEHRGLGTTATVAGQLGDTLYLVQVGDSRAYLVRGGVARQITKDQSLMQRLIEAGELTPEEAERSERRNIILQALGPEPAVNIDLTYQRLRRGDVLVLCTDGLSGLVRPAEIAAVITAEPDLALACKSLIDLANEDGGPDNITVVAARFEGSGLALPAPDDEIGHAAYPLRRERTPARGRPLRTESGRTTPPAGSATADAEVTGARDAAAPGSRFVILAIAVAALVIAALLLAARDRGANDPPVHVAPAPHRTSAAPARSAGSQPATIPARTA